MIDIETKPKDDIETKPKDPKRVAAGKKGAEAKKMKAELKRKETETMKKENMELKHVTKEPIYKKDVVVHQNIYKNYIPLCFVIGVVGLGLYVYKSSSTSVKEVVKPPPPQKEIDPFEF